MTEYFNRYIGINFIINIVLMVIHITGVGESLTGSKAISLSFWGWSFALIFGTILMAMGALLGRLFLDFAKPDYYYTSGTGDAIMKKIFWSVGPQFIGGLVGLGATGAILIRFFDVMY